MGQTKTMTLCVTGLDDLDPAAAFLAREQGQLGELEEEIGSLSGAPYIMTFFTVKSVAINIKQHWHHKIYIKTT